MKRILMSLMVIAVAVALIGTASVAHYSDTEESFDNYMVTGSLDLVVNGQHDEPWGQGVPMKVHLDSMQPDKSYDFPFEMTSASQDCYGNAFIHIKNIEHSDVVPWNIDYAIPDPVTGSPKPEPEIVAEYGGWLGQVWVNGLGGAYGEDSHLSNHIEVIEISWEIENQLGDPPPPPWAWNGSVDLRRFDTNPQNGVVKLNELECHNILLAVIPPEDAGGKYTLYGDLHFMLQDIDEDDPALWESLGIPIGDPVFAGIDNDGDGLIDEDCRDGIDNDGDGLVDEDPCADDNPATIVDEGGYFDGSDPDIKAKSWDHWPTNALQKDMVTFDILFSLAQFDP